MSRKILIIDDEDSYREPIARYLRKKGIEVNTASDARQALALLQYTEGRYDIVFVDQLLFGSEYDGIELVKIISGKYPHLPVIVVTGWLSEEKGLESLHGGAYRYISKSAGILEIELLIELAPELIPVTDRVISTTSRDFRTMPIINILVIFANPPSPQQLNTGYEDRIIRESLQLSKYRDNINLNVLHGVTVHNLRRALLNDTYHILHFAGHGVQEGLIFESESGRYQKISPPVLAEFLAAYSPPLECVLLNACYSFTSGELISMGVPYTIGMNDRIQDRSAVEFSRGFYDALGAKKDVEFAYQEGVRAMKFANIPSVQYPVLIKRNDAPTTN